MASLAERAVAAAVESAAWVGCGYTVMCILHTRGPDSNCVLAAAGLSRSRSGQEFLYENR